MGYDASYRVYGDFDLNQRMAKAGHIVMLSDEVVADHRNDGLSVNGINVHWTEVFRSIKRNFGILLVPIAYVWFLLSPLRGRFKSWRSQIGDFR